MIGNDISIEEIVLITFITYINSPSRRGIRYTGYTVNFVIATKKVSQLPVKE